MKLLLLLFILGADKEKCFVDELVPCPQPKPILVCDKPAKDGTRKCRCTNCNTIVTASCTKTREMPCLGAQLN